MSHRAKDTRIFKVPRILSAVETAERFERPTDFSLEDQFQSSFGIFRTTGEPVEITVRFTGGVAALVEERVWHESQQLAWQPAEETLFEHVADEPDALLATYKLSGLVEFKRWIKGLGGQAEILKPTWLRLEIRDELLGAAKQHGA